LFIFLFSPPILNNLPRRIGFGKGETLSFSDKVGKMLLK
jgi:hypothetical protein